jgi:RNA polymerase sigma-70 factor (ECF subfamily)
VSAAAAARDYARLDEAGLCRLAQRGDGAAFGAITQRCNERLFRLARGVVGDDNEAEDVLQETYVRAFAALPGYRGESSLATWLAAIALNEARGRLRKRRRLVDLALVDEHPRQVIGSPADPGPEASAARAEARRLLERAIDALPTEFRLVFLLREVEGCSVAETAGDLAIKPATVRTRLHRARALLRRALDATLADAVTETFPFRGARCARITGAVLTRLGLSG